MKDNTQTSIPSVETKPAPKVSAYPLHEKLKARRAESLALSGFLDMLDEMNLHLAKYHEHAPSCIEGDCWLRSDTPYDIRVPSKEQLIGLYLGIDPTALSTEKDAMYAEITASQELS